MAKKILPQPDNSGNLDDFSNLSEAELSTLLDLIQSQVEFHRDEIARLKPILHRLQARIPTDNPFRDFINSLD